MWKKTIGVLSALNLALVLTLFALPATPTEAAAKGWMDCCQSSTSGERFCCDNCCWITHNCSVDSQCGFDPE